MQENIQDSKKSSEVLAEVYRNARLAIDAISDVLPETEEGELKNEIISQHEEYEKISSEALILAEKMGADVKDPSLFKKAMMWTSIKMNTAGDNSASHIAEMMIQGTVMGITALRSSLSDSEGVLDESVGDLLTRLIRLEEDFEEKLKKYL